jgi:hypothetical protein
MPMTPTQLTRLQKLGECLDVGGHARHDPPAHLLVVVVERQPLQVSERARPQRVHDPLGGVRCVHQLDDLVSPTEQLDREEHNAHHHQDAAAMAFDTAVEAVTDQQRTDQCRAGIDQHQQTDEEQRQSESTRHSSQRRRTINTCRVVEIHLRIATQRWQGIDTGEQFGSGGHETGAAGEAVNRPTGGHRGQQRGHFDSR